MSTDKATITDPVRRRTYSPTEEACRKAPAFICNVATRVHRLRFKLDELDKEQLVTPEPMTFTLRQLHQILAEYVAPVPFEEDLLSSDIARVNDAIEKF